MLIQNCRSYIHLIDTSLAKICNGIKDFLNNRSFLLWFSLIFPCENELQFFVFKQGLDVLASGDTASHYFSNLVTNNMVM